MRTSLLFTMELFLSACGGTGGASAMGARDLNATEYILDFLLAHSL